MAMMIPRGLKQGDTIGLIAPASQSRTPGAVDRAVKYIEGMGYRVKQGENLKKVYGHLSGTDEERANDLHTMFADDEVDAVICLRGGYGTPRLLDKIDYAMIEAHPKIFMGFSDITALLNAIAQKSGLVTFHGPNAVEWPEERFQGFSREHVLSVLEAPAKAYDFCNPEGMPLVCMQKGECEGTLAGGNLSLMAATMGTPWEIDAGGKILLIEEIGEKTYAVDRMLNQLRLGGKFEECAGVIFGGFTHCEVEYPEYGLTLNEVIADLVLPAGKPVLAGWQIGHVSPGLTVPVGGRVYLDATHKRAGYLGAE